MEWAKVAERYKASREVFGMKTAVCEMCLRSGILCTSCNEKLKSGQITEAEVKVAETLLKLSSERRQLKDVSIRKVIDSGDVVVIVCGRGDAAKVIGASGQNAKRLEKELSRKVMVVEEAQDMKEFVRNLLRPVHVVSTSALYKNGMEIIKVTTGDRRGQKISSSDFSKIMKAVYGMDAEIAG
jgi:transcription antitermination factor NusA-like protein